MYNIRTRPSFDNLLGLTIVAVSLRKGKIRFCTMELVGSCVFIGRSTFHRDTYTTSRLDELEIPLLQFIRNESATKSSRAGIESLVSQIRLRIFARLRVAFKCLTNVQKNISCYLK